MKVTKHGLLSLFLFLLMILSIPQVLPADVSSGEFDGFDDSFDESSEDPFGSIDMSIPEHLTVLSDPGPFVMGGFIKIEAEAAFNGDDDNLSKLKAKFFTEAEYRISETLKIKASANASYDFSYSLADKERNTGFRQDDSRSELDLEDAFIDVKISDTLSFKAGRQIVVWGQSDYARITDIVNPRDMTSPGLIDLEDARLPVTALRMTMQTDLWTLEGVTIHEHPGSRISGKGGDFDYYKSMRSPMVRIFDKKSPDSFEHITTAFKATRTFNGGDVSFVAASNFDDLPYLRYDGPDNGIMTFTPEYNRVQTLGLSTGFARGPALFKAETALTLDRKLMQDDILTQINSGLPASQVQTAHTGDQVQGLIGMEYTGFTDLRLVLEAQAVHTLDAPGNLVIDDTEYISYFQATKYLMNEALELDLLWVHMYPGHGDILRLSGTYDLVDDLEIQAGLAFYSADTGESNLYAYKDQDRIFIRIKYSF